MISYRVVPGKVEVNVLVGLEAIGATRLLFRVAIAIARNNYDQGDSK